MDVTALKIGLVQMNVEWEDPAANIHHLEKMLNPHPEADLLLLPEMWSTGFTMRPELFTKKENGHALQWMINYSQKLNCAIAGSLSAPEDEKYYNRLYCVHPNGKIDQYDKRHLFSYGMEDQHYTAGDQRIIIEIKGWRIMPIICYDLRFPAWCRNHLDYELLIVVANWPKPRIAHWDALLKARAIENQSYIAAVNRIGRDGSDLEYPGHSSIYDMNGQSITIMDHNEGIETYTLEKSMLTEYRERFRFLQDRDDFSLKVE